MLTEMETTTSSSDKIRNRTRAPLTNIDELAQTVFIENKKQNKAKSAYEGARKALYDLMQTMGKKSYVLNGRDLDGQPVVLEATISSPPASMISIDKLFELVPSLNTDPEMRKKILSATRKDVETHVGSFIADQATVSGLGKENVSVKPVGGK